MKENFRMLGQLGGIEVVRVAFCEDVVFLRDMKDGLRVYEMK